LSVVLKRIRVYLVDKITKYYDKIG